ncbi:oxidoreductase [Colletotrichum musicola]|uniref:Oxidoreductase n=1 Tax=Colletotrichum musicola TaxID=2175873 RepID=A0A8H6KEE9_9PEZI|nr:oxidoreductase [Colletotrichum musicola]
MYTVEPPSLDCLARQSFRAFNGNAIANDTFAVGGTIPIHTGPAEDSSEQKPASYPVILRWDATEETPALRRVAFPLATDADSASFAQLLQDMQPATFGLGDKHVLDEEYRKAIKLPVTAFSVSFSPYELGIIDTPMIQWAAFYSDCEHEVHEVTSGHRVTVTYNLYATKAAMCTSLSSLDPESLPLYNDIRALVTDPRFKVKKCVLGFHGAFEYPHTSANHDLPFCLKGLDMAVYEIFRCMGLKIHLSAVIPADDTVRRCKSDKATDGTCFSDDGSSNGESDDQYDEDDSSLATQTVVRPICAKSSLGIMDDDSGEGDVIDFVLGGEQVEAKDIIWINNRQRHSQEQASYISYGNEPSHDSLYSYSATVVEIPAKCSAK